jgi:tRNA (guanine26-N2/guanine27-N2)-dimethyltransferase
METKMQKTKLFKLQKVTKKERKMRAEAEAAAAAAAAAEPEAFESECDDDDEACLIKEAMARAKEEKKRQRKKQRKKTNGSAVSSSVPKDSLSGDSTSSGISASEDAEDSRDAKDAAYDSLGTVAVTTKDARRLFASLFASNAERFDVVDVDSFGSDNFIDDALRVTKLGGYCYATGTDALALCGKNPPRLLSHYGGAFVVPNVSAVNETGLRVFVGDAVRRGAAQGLKVTPAFSLFHPHGPVFRAMLKVEKLVGAWDGESIGFLAQCDSCGDARVAESDEIRDGACFCRRCAKRDAAEKTRMSVSGPLWTGPLHDAAAVAALAREAEEVDFCGGDDEGRFSGEDGGVPEEHELSSTKGQKASAKELLAAFAAEADPALPPFYRRTDELARAGRGLKHGIPPLDAWIAELQTRGFAACRSHLDARGLKSNAPLDDVVAAANAVAAAKNGGA